MRTLLWAGVLGLGLILTAPGQAEEPRAAKIALSDYFPPSESKGGWRSLLPEEGEPGAARKAEIARKAGVDWDRLKEAWEHNARVEGASGLLVIRKGYVVGEWYKDGGRDKAFNIYSSSKAYTSLAFGLLLFDAEAGKLPVGRRPKRHANVCSGTWLPETLPVPNPGKTDITLRQL